MSLGQKYVSQGTALKSERGCQLRLSTGEGASSTLLFLLCLKSLVNTVGLRSSYARSEIHSCADMSIRDLRFVNYKRTALGPDMPVFPRLSGKH